MPNLFLSMLQDCGSGHYVEVRDNNETCEVCPAGKYAGAAMDSNCSSCPSGTYAARGAASCNSCLPGEYATDDVNDVDGVGVSSDATTCRSCAAGTKSDIASWQCTACLEDYFQPDNGSSMCLKCSSEFGSAYTTIGDGQVSCERW